MKIQPYLNRIHANKIDNPDLAALQHLQEQHMFHVPFENLDVIYHIPIILDINKFYDKIINRHRGGFCYELNGLFNWLLQQLGYQSYLVAGTVRQPGGTWAMNNSHAAIIVELDQPYLADVGFGNSTRMPLPLTGEPKEDVSGIYRVQHVENDTYDLQRKIGTQGWQILHRFHHTAQPLEDFEDACHYNQTSDQSHFTQKELVSIARPDGRITLTRTALNITKQGVKQQMEIQAGAEVAILRDTFGIENVVDMEKKD